jgi:diamine N-acetyltransferase
MSLTLERLTEVDIDFVTQSEEHPDNRRFVGQWTHEQYRQALTDPNYGCFGFVVNQVLVGHCILANLQDPDDAIQLKRLVVAIKGNGYGRAALTEIIRYVFETLNANRLWLDVRSFNSRAEGLYRSVGFQYEGTQRKASKMEDVYYDLNLYGMLREEYR